MSKIGVLAIQGDFLEHRQMLDLIDVESVEIRLPDQLKNVDGLIIPGGESTTIAQLIDIYQFREPIRKRVSTGLPVWGTCAGLILLANKLTSNRPSPLGLMEIEVNRNAFGRQVDSFESLIPITGITGPAYNCIFIRAPSIEKIGDSVEVLATLKNGTPIAVKQNHMLATSFHPELTRDPRIHELFSRIVEENR